MPSPSELPGIHEAVVTRTFAEEEKNVERLEFQSIEDNEARQGHNIEALLALEAKVAALEDELRVQAEAATRHLEEARLLARLLARKEWEQELERRLKEDREMVRRACEEFDRERTRYFTAVEAQVVKLSLAIAGRVLYREAKMDPMLLTAAVRVALEKVKDESGTRLRVPLADVGLWSATFAAGDAKSKVEIVGDDTMPHGECVLETSVGTVELGIEGQLAEIERGFYDLMQKRPA